MQELIKTLRWCMKHGCDGCPSKTNGINCGTIEEQAADAIERLIAEDNKNAIFRDWANQTITEMTEANRWIPVRERLPEDGQMCLCLSEYWGSAIMDIHTFHTNFKDIMRRDTAKNAFWDYDSEEGYFTVSGITHWRPLPEPPKGADDRCTHKTTDGYCKLHSDGVYQEPCVEGPCPDEAFVKGADEK